jgi:hypothetical protein
MKIFILVETTESGQMHILAAKSLSNLIKSFSFNSSKSLVSFLEKYKEEIINKLGDSEHCETLEYQNFLGYLNVKWYEQAAQDKKMVGREYLSPQQILDLAVECKAVDEKQIHNYLLKSSDECQYTLQIQDLE